MGLTITNREIPARVGGRQAFRANSTTGQWVSILTTAGLLPEVWRVALRADFHASDEVYVVKSYETPIAWWTATSGWVLPDVRYSVTTTRVQNAIRATLERAAIAYRYAA